MLKPEPTMAGVAGVSLTERVLDTVPAMGFRTRMTYRRPGPDEFGLLSEISAPGQGYETMKESRFRRFN